MRFRNVATAALATALLAGPLAGHLTSVAHAETHPNQRHITGYNAAIDVDKALSISSVDAGQIAGFNPAPIADAAVFLRDIAAKGAMPEWYWIGANCVEGADCEQLRKAGVKLGSTGTPEWNKTEQRIYNLRAPAAIARTRTEIRRALAAASDSGSDLLFRIDNMHNLVGKSYDVQHVRPYAELASLVKIWLEEVRKFRADGQLSKSQLVGLSAHNNFKFWSKWIANGGARPLVLSLENPTQEPQDLKLGLSLMRQFEMPFIAMEFERGLDYVPTQEQITSIAKRVSMMVVVKDERNFVPDRIINGPGPRDIRP